MSKPTPKWLADFRSAYREHLPRLSTLRASGKSWDEIRLAVEADDPRVAGQGHPRWRNEWWLAARDGVRPADAIPAE